MTVKWRKNYSVDVKGDIAEITDAFGDVGTMNATTTSDGYDELYIDFSDAPYMQFTREQIAELIPLLQRFVDTGTIAPEGE